MSSKDKKEAKREREFALLAEAFGRSDLDGKTCFHNGPSYQGNAISLIGVTPVIPVVRKGSKHSLEHHHLWRLKKRHATADAWMHFERVWEEQKKSPDPSILSTIYQVYKADLLLAFLLQLVACASQYALPVMMPYITQWFIWADFLPFWWVFVYAAAVFSAQICQCLFQYHCMLVCYDFGVRVRGSLTTMIYRKSLFSRLGRTQTSGMVVNLISTDAQILLETLSYFMQGILAPVQIVVTLGLLSRYLKAFCLISFAVAVIAGPLSGILASNIGFYMVQIQKKGDTRLKLVKEFLTAIRIVKYYAWEKPFLNNISKSRMDQLVEVKNFLVARAWLISVLMNIPGLGIGLTFFFFGIKNNMNFEAVFSALAYLNLLTLPFIFLPMLVSFCAQYYASLKRIEFFGLRSELEVRQIEPYEDDTNDGDEDEEIEPSSTSSSPSEDGTDGKPRKKTSLKKTKGRPKGGMYIRGASFAWETLVSIAEGRFIDLENKEMGETAAVSAAGTAAEKKALSEVLEHTKAEKLHVANLVRVIQKQLAEGVSVDDVNIDEEEKDCVEAEQEPEKVDDTDAEGELVEDVAVETEKKSKKNKKKGEKGKKEKKFTKLRRPTVNLHDVDFDVRPGSLTMVVGSVGSGKSTLAMAFLGEIHQIGGVVKVFDEFSYSSQEAWILNATIRDNITFGSEFEPERYEQVIHACALAQDLASFPASDLTEIGERGINLSGGQKQRINVARAMYSRAPIVILDDPFSAVDSHVGEHMFEHVAKGLRKAGRTLLLITNQLHFVQHADHIGVLKRGRIVEQGSYDELVSNRRGTLSKMLAKQRSAEEEQAASSTVDEKASSSAVALASSNAESSKLNESSQSLKKSTELIMQQAIVHDADDEAAKKFEFKHTPEHDEENRRKGVLILLEEREQGNIGWETYWSYMKSGSLAILFIYMLLQAANIAMRVFSGIWLSWWADPRNARGFTKGQFLGGYMGLVLGQAVTTCIGSLTFVYFSVNTGRGLHALLLKSVAIAPTGWFDRTPLGRVIARFSKDVSQIDLELPSMFDQTINFLFSLIGLFASIATGTAYILIIIAIGFIGFGLLTLHYRKTSIQVQRIEALSRAPIFSHFAETLEGAVTIRAFRMDHIFRVANMNKIDTNNVDFMGLRFCSVWFAMTLDCMGALMVFLSYLAMILARHYAPKSVNIGYIIFAISQTGGVTQTLAAVSHMITDLENKMNAVERILQYTRVESEGPFEVPENKPDPSWPSQGHIVLDRLTVEYKKDLPVLHGISCEIKPREKIGIVGRTGAGKSTLITALFRTMEPKSGSIIIDGVDITKIGLTDLRSKLSIIPQTPQLFVGTVRYNLDPFEEHQDEAIWKVLKMVKLKKHVAGLPGGLLAPVEENGSNFSVGQRQLLAMARCLLRETHVLLLDEATAAVDVETDALLQKMIRSNFRDKTVLTIAHRLNTIMDSDRILVLDAGRIAEFDTPKKLLKNTKGIFYGMVQATGPQTAAYLHEIANSKRPTLEEVEIVPARKKKSSSK